MNRISLIIGFAVTVATAAEAQDFSFHRDLAAGTRVWIRNVIGDVRIEGTAGRAFEVTARKKAGRHGDPADVEIKTLEVDGGVAICVYYPSQGRRRDRDRDRDRHEDRDDSAPRRHRNQPDPCHRDSEWGGDGNRNDTSVEFMVRLPAGLIADLKTVSGDLVGTGLRGTLNLGTVSGDLRLTDVAGDALDAGSVSGNVELDRVVVRDVSAETVSGNVTFVGPIDGKGTYDLKTLSGDVTVTLPKEPDAKMSAVTFSGKIDSDLPVSTTGRHRRNRYSATWGAGTGQLDLESFSGDIRIRTTH